MEGDSLQFVFKQDKTTSENEQKTLVQISTSSQNVYDRNSTHENVNNQHYLKIVNQQGGSEFRHQYMLKRHLPGHTDERNYHCTICAKSFRQLSTLTQHKAIHSQARPHTCVTCKKTFNRISTLISHRKTHTDEKPFKCTMCNKGFHQKGNLRNHLYSHTNERPYRCGVCNKGFNQQSNLTCHLKKVHGCIGKTNDNIKSRYEKAPLAHPRNDTSLNVHVNPSSTILVDEIKTIEMEKILQHNQVPFALLKHENNRPVLVRIYTSTANDGKHMLVPITTTDLMSRGELILGKHNDNRSQGAFDINDPLLHLNIPLAAILESKISPEGLHTITVHSPTNYFNNGVPECVKVEKSSSDESYIIPDYKAVDNSEYSLTQMDSKGFAAILCQESKVVFGSESHLIAFSPEDSKDLKTSIAPSTRDPIMNNSQERSSSQMSSLKGSSSQPVAGSHNLGNPFISSHNLMDFPGLPSLSADYDIQLFDNLDCMETFCRKI